MNTGDNKLAKDSVLPNYGCNSTLDDKRKQIFGIVEKMSAFVDTIDTAEGERKFRLIFSNLLTKDLLDRER